MNWKIDNTVNLDNSKTVRDIMKELREGKYFRKG